MRVGLVCPYSFDAPGGVQNHVLGLAGWLQRTGHEPRILAPGRVPAEVLERRALAPAHVTSTGATLPVRWNGSVARIAGGPVVARRVRHWLAETRADVLHLHEPITPSAAFWALALARPALGCAPIVATFHAATPRSRTLALAGLLLQPLLRHIDIPLAVSATAADVVRDHLGLTARVVPNGIEVADLTGPRPAGRSRRLVFLGRVTEPRKGLDVLLDAVPAIRRAVPELDIVIAGPGERALPPGVRRVGAPDDPGKAALLRSADLFIAPHTGRESFGLVLVEAMAAGTPVVAADLPAFVDVLRTPAGGLLGHTFAVGDPTALAAAVITALTTDAPAPGDLIDHARRYDWESVGPRLLAEYSRALTNRAGRQ
jgi:phosphatidylinositol alpha-mannosyltransferase